MPTWDRDFWNAARLIAPNLPPHPNPEPPLTLATLERTVRLRHLAATAQQRGWFVAAAHLRRTLRQHATGLLRELQRFVNDTERDPVAVVATPGDLYRDLVALTTEFAAVDVDADEKTVAVTTERIVLEDVDLGPFQIVWHWDRPDADDDLRVIATDEQPAAERDDVSHPHVRDEVLCTGRAEEPLRRAFRSGRLFDALLIIRQTLRTYNPQSAYVRLADWRAHRCADCGATVPDDEVTLCARCHVDLCGDCPTSCDTCGEACCANCLTRCAKCEVLICSTCRPVVDGRWLSLCHSCHTEEPDDDDADETNPTDDEVDEAGSAADPDAAVQSDGVGEAPLPAGCG